MDLGRRIRLHPYLSGRRRDGLVLDMVLLAIWVIVVDGGRPTPTGSHHADTREEVRG